MKIFAVQVYEPEDVFMLRVQEGSFFDLGGVGLYTDRESAELEAKNYNEEFNDETPAQVVELEVNEASIPQAKIEGTFETDDPAKAA
jgi:hypothetical protein